MEMSVAIFYQIIAGGIQLSYLFTDSLQKIWR